MKKINKNDIFINEVTYYPKYEWYAPIESNCLFLNNQKNKYYDLVSESGSKVDLFEIATNAISPYQYIVNKKQYDTYGGVTLQNEPYGSIITSSLIGTSSLAIENISLNGSRTHIHALKNTLNYYSSVNPAYNYDNFLTSSLINIFVPSLFYGSSIKRGSVEIKVTAITDDISTTYAVLQDIYSNGTLYNISSSVLGSTISPVGVTLYSEGVVIINNSSIISLLGSKTIQLTYNGTTKINRLNIFAECGKIEFNNSNNPTYKQNISGSSFTSSSKAYVEGQYQQIYNINSSSYSTYDEEYQKVTYISSIGLFDAEKNLIGIAKLSKPLKKTINDSYTFKLKYDI